MQNDVIDSAQAQADRHLAYALLRATMGINFLGHGFIRLLHGNAAFAQNMVKQMAETPLPAWFVYPFGWTLPLIELTLGLLLLIGVFTRQALIAGALLMMALMVGVTLRQDWNTAGSQLLYSLIFSALLFARARYDRSWLDLARLRSGH